MDKEIQIIETPSERFRLSDGKFYSAAEIYASKQGLFNKLCNGKFENVVLSETVKIFFDEKINRKTINKLPNFKAVEHIQRMWLTFTLPENNASKQIDLKSILYKLDIDTCKGIVIWEQMLNTISNGTKKQKYHTKYEDIDFYLTIMSYKNVNNEVRNKAELQYQRDNGPLFNCSNSHNANIYNSIIKNGSYKKEKENPHIKKREAGESKKVIAINHGDFIVRTNLFRCYHKDHLVEEIIGLLKVATPIGKVIEEKIPCAYCPECNCFFMLTSEYKRISEKGILLCQLIDKEQYYQNGKLDKFNGASESLLMQNGYNVKANVGLTDIQRQIILKNIIDSNILSQHRILSYLDAFIAQKVNMPQYKEAVHKWQKDKEFVRNYDAKSKRVVEINSIKK